MTIELTVLLPYISIEDTSSIDSSRPYHLKLGWVEWKLFDTRILNWWDPLPEIQNSQGCAKSIFRKKHGFHWNWAFWLQNPENDYKNEKLETGKTIETFWKMTFKSPYFSV